MYARTTAIRCPSTNPVEICCVLGFSNSRNELTILDGCGYCGNTGQCHYRGKIKHTPSAAREEHKERRKPGRGQVSLHAFLGGGGA